MIEARGVWFRYTGSRWILRGITVALRRGEILAITGPNGGGKTTLLKIMSGLLKPQQGGISIMGRDPWGGGRDAQYARRSVVYVGERPVLVKGSIMDNLLLGFRLRGEDPDTATLHSVVSMLGMEDLLGKSPKSLSAGEAQIVSIARAIVLKPSFLLLDEPFSHLDRARRRILAEALEALRGEGMGIAIASHNEGILGRLASRGYWVEDGRVDPL